MYDGEITIDDLESDLAAFAEQAAKKHSRWTPELDRLLVHAREDLGMTWDDLARWWKSKIGWGAGKTLNAHYKELKARG